MGRLDQNGPYLKSLDSFGHIFVNWVVNLAAQECFESQCSFLVSHFLINTHRHGSSATGYFVQNHATQKKTYRTINT